MKTEKVYKIVQRHDGHYWSYNPATTSLTSDNPQALIYRPLRWTRPIKPHWLLFAFKDLDSAHKWSFDPQRCSIWRAQAIVNHGWKTVQPYGVQSSALDEVWSSDTHYAHAPKYRFVLCHQIRLMEKLT